MNTTEDQKWFMNMKLTHEHTNWTHEYGRLVLSTNDESWRMSKPGKPITVGLIDHKELKTSGKVVKNLKNYTENHFPARSTDQE